ncbi:hypothetical protein [Methanoregula sp.]|uniref:hypothetical protein n=1 Tax=Methanoregula sp. TaxID=2052170 RepID=UPI003563F53A
MARFNLGRFNLSPFNRAGGARDLTSAATFQTAPALIPAAQREIDSQSDTIATTIALVATPTAHIYDGILICKPTVGARASGLAVSARSSSLSVTLRDSEVEAI